MRAVGPRQAGFYDRGKRPEDTAQDVLRAVAPAPDILSKKELGRGVLHPHPLAKRAALELVLHVLDRFVAEARFAVQLYGGCVNGPARRPPVKAILACARAALDGEDVGEVLPQGGKRGLQCHFNLRI